MPCIDLGLVKHLPPPPECSLTSGNCLFRNRVGDRLASKPILRDQAHLQIATAIVGASKLVTPASNPGLDSGSYDIHPRAVVSAFLSEWGFFLTQGASRCAADLITLQYSITSTMYNHWVHLISEFFNSCCCSAAARLIQYAGFMLVELSVF